MKEINFKLKLFGFTILSFDFSKTEDEVVNYNLDDNKLIEKFKSSEKINNTISNGTIRPDLKELEKKIFNKENIPDPIKVKCSTCNGTTYDDDIDFCIKCGKEICSNCGSIDTDGKKYCTECWTSL